MLRRRCLLGGKSKKRLSNGLYFETLDHRVIPIALDNNGTITSYTNTISDIFHALGIQTPYNEINSVILVTDTFSARIRTSSIYVTTVGVVKGVYYLDYLTPIPGANSTYNSWYSSPSSKYEAYDYYGYERRDKYNYYNDRDYIVGRCYNYTWLDGHTGGYLPSQGELTAFMRYRSICNPIWGTYFDLGFTSTSDRIVTSTPASSSITIRNGIKLYNDIQYYNCNTSSFSHTDTALNNGGGYYYFVFDRYDPYDYELAYDSQVEYLESRTGSLSIDTGFQQKDIQKFSIKYYNTSDSSGGYGNVMGARHYSGTNEFGVSNYSGGLISVGTRNTSMGNVKNRVNEVIYNGGSTVLVNGTSKSITVSSMTLSATIRLFAIYENAYNWVTQKQFGRIYYVNLEGNGKKISLIPVRIGTTGFFFDKEHGTYLTKSESTSEYFGYGSDI